MKKLLIAAILVVFGASTVMAQGYGKGNGKRRNQQQFQNCPGSEFMVEFRNQRQEERKEFILNLVKEGKLTQEQADLMLSRGPRGKRL